MKTSPNCTAVIQYCEQCRLKSYPDPESGGAPWTVGWGATGPGIGPGVVWTQDQADTRLARDIVLVESDANNAIRLPVTQGQFDGFVSILYNVGHGSPIRDGIIRLKTTYPSTLLRLLNAGDFQGAREAFASWVGHPPMLGLRRRRRMEQALWDGESGHDAIAAGAAIN